MQAVNAGSIEDLIPAGRRESGAEAFPAQDALDSQWKDACRVNVVKEQKPGRLFPLIFFCAEKKKKKRTEKRRGKSSGHVKVGRK